MFGKGFLFWMGARAKLKASFKCENTMINEIIQVDR